MAFGEPNNLIKSENNKFPSDNWFKEPKTAPP
jgi:hypothetical protein